MKLTREEIMSLQEGPEMDRAINAEFGISLSGPNAMPSKSMGDAWPLLDAYMIAVMQVLGSGENNWSGFVAVHYTQADFTDRDNIVLRSDRRTVAQADSAAMAVCRCAMLVKATA